MADSISPDELNIAVGEVLQTFSHNVTTLVDQAAMDVGRAGANLLKTGSPRVKGNYARSWTADQTKKGTVYIHNKKHYRLTHLLEKGHKTNFKHGKYGRLKTSKAIPHISVVEGYVQLNFEYRVKNAIEYQK